MDGLFGREREIRAIEQFVTTIPQVRPSANGPLGMLIRGDAGIGKTSLWRVALARARDARFQVLAARCAQAEALLSFTALGDLLDPVPEDVLASLSGPQRRALDVALLREDAGPHPTDWRAVALATLAVVRLISRRGPVLLAVDDLQWLDGPSARIISFALRRLTDEPVGFLATVRRGLLAEDPEDGARRSGQVVIAESDATTLSVGPLDPADIAAAIRQRLPDSLLPAQLADVVAVAGGNPFFAIELALAMADARAGSASGAAPRAGAQTGASSLVAPDVRSLPVPAAIAALLSRHLTGLSAHARELIVLTTLTTQPTIAMAERFFRDERATAEAVDATVALGLLTVDTTRIRLAHPLLGTAAAADLSASRLRALHAQLADLVADDEERAVHLALAASGPGEEVAAALEKAAAKARQRGALEAAAGLSERAVSLTPVSDLGSRGRRLVIAGECRWQLGDMTAASQLLRQALSSMPGGPLRARALICLARVLFHSQVTEAAAALNEALDACGDDLPLRTQALIDLAFVASNTTDRFQARPMAQEAVRLAQDLTDEDLKAQALAVLALCELVDGELAADQTLDLALESEARAVYLPPARSATFIAGLRAMWAGDTATARARIEAVHRRAMDWAEESSITDVLTVLAEVECRAGNWNAAAAHAAAARQLAEAETHERVQASAISALAMIAAMRGDAPACKDAVAAGLALATKTESMAAIVACSTAMGLLSLSLGDYAETDRQLAWLCDRFVIQSIDPGISLFVAEEVEALIGLENLTAAAALLDLYETRARALSTASATAVAVRCRALLLAATGDIPAAMAVADEAVLLAEGIGQPCDLARAHLTRGSVLRRARRWREARRALEQAVAGFDALGAVAWATRGRQQLERLGGRRSGSTELTRGEAQVVRLAAAGRTNREIATELFISIRAVEKALTGVYRKVGVRSRTELTAWLATRSGVPGSPQSGSM